jgi:hypothetical protein
MGSHVAAEWTKVLPNEGKALIGPAIWLRIRTPIEHIGNIAAQVIGYHKCVCFNVWDTIQNATSDLWGAQQHRTLIATCIIVF